MKASDPKKPFWLIADELGLAGPNQRIKQTDTQAELTDKKNLLASTASRYYRKATEMIKRTGEGKFPH
jgi:hypothetical protein